MHCRESVVPDLESPGLPDPGQAALYHVADHAQATAVRCPRPGQVVLDAPLLQALPVARRAIGSVPVQSFRLAARSAPSPADRRDVIEQRERLGGVGAIRSRDAHGQGRAVPIDEEMPFGAFFGSIRGVFAGKDPPKTARMLWLSTQAFSQSIRPARPRRSSRVRSNFFHTPRRCQSRSRRQQVTPEPQPISWGRSSQGMPLRRTKTIPVKHARSSTGGRPRLPGLALWRGSRGWTASHSSSGTRGPGIMRLQRSGTGYWLF
jgi:hypothetical protein